MRRPKLIIGIILVSLVVILPIIAAILAPADAHAGDGKISNGVIIGFGAVWLTICVAAVTLLVLDDKEQKKKAAEITQNPFVPSLATGNSKDELKKKQRNNMPGFIFIVVIFIALYGFSIYLYFSSPDNLTWAIICGIVSELFFIMLYRRVFKGKVKRSALIPKVGLLALILGLLAVPLVNELYQEITVGPFKNYLADYSALKPTEIGPETYTGRVVVIDMKSKKIDQGVYFSLPDNIKAHNPSEVETVVQLFRDEQSVGMYEDNAGAYEKQCEVLVLDATTGRLIDKQYLSGSSPPDVKTGEGARSGSDVPSEWIIDSIVGILQNYSASSANVTTTSESGPFNIAFIDGWDTSAIFQDLMRNYVESMGGEFVYETGDNYTEIKELIDEDIDGIIATSNAMPDLGKAEEAGISTLILTASTADSGLEQKGVFTFSYADPYLLGVAIGERYVQLIGGAGNILIQHTYPFSSTDFYQQIENGARNVFKDYYPKIIILENLYGAEDEASALLQAENAINTYGADLNGFLALDFCSLNACAAVVSNAGLTDSIVVSGYGITPDCDALVESGAVPVFFAANIERFGEAAAKLMIDILSGKTISEGTDLGISGFNNLHVNYIEVTGESWIEINQDSINNADGS